MCAAVDASGLPTAGPTASGGFLGEGSDGDGDALGLGQLLLSVLGNDPQDNCAVPAPARQPAPSGGSSPCAINGRTASQLSMPAASPVNTVAAPAATPSGQPAADDANPLVASAAASGAVANADAGASGQTMAAPQFAAAAAAPVVPAAGSVGATGTSSAGSGSEDSADDADGGGRVEVALALQKLPQGTGDQLKRAGQACD